MRLACFLGLLTAFIAALWALTVLAQTPPLKVTLSVPANTQLTEGGGNSVVTVTASIASGRSADLIIDLSLGGTAKSSDYEVVGSLPAITITAGQTTGTGDVTLSAMDDSFFEGPETLRVEGTIRGQPQDEVSQRGHHHCRQRQRSAVERDRRSSKSLDPGGGAAAVRYRC